MDKIKQLMMKSGLSESAASQICEHLNAHATQLRETYEAEFKTRLSKAKEVCLKETDEHKRDLSRRVQIFLETKSAAIQEHLRRLAAEKDTEAVAKLEKITGLLEGIELDGQSNSELVAKLEKSERVAKRLLEQRDLAVKKANRVQSVASKVLSRNRLLESRVSGTNGSAKPNSRQGTIKEGAGEGSNGRTLDRRRRSGSPTSTRRTIRETADRTPPPRAAQPDIKAGGNGTMSMMSPDDIADQIDDAL